MTTSITHCRRCGQMLTDPASIRNGIGPECQEREADRAAALAPFTIGTRVLITAGPARGSLATVSTVNPLRKGKPSPRPVQVMYDRFGSDFYAPDQLTIVTDPSLMSGTTFLQLSGGAR
jgi:hypothetical protein